MTREHGPFGDGQRGLGRAHVFMAQPHYQDQFREILGSKAWPGTLNMEVDANMLSHYIALRQKAGIDTLDAPMKTERRPKASMFRPTNEFGFEVSCETVSPSAGLQRSRAPFTTTTNRLSAPSFIPDLTAMSTWLR